MRKVVVNGKEVMATQVGFSTIGEPWAEYRLEDGSTARVKFVMTRILKTEERTPAGDPVYSFDGQPILVVDEPRGQVN